MIGRAATVILACLALAACSSNPSPSPSPSSQPTAGVPLSASPPPSPTPQPATNTTEGEGARLEISASGSCHGINYALCYAALLLGQNEARTLFDWAPADSDMRFADSATYPLNTITGPPTNAPTRLAQGRWAVGIGVAQGSDVPAEPVAGAPRCVTEFDVGPDTESVRITASLDDACALDVTLSPTPSIVPARVVAIPPWSPPPGGIMDDCHYGTMLLRFDPDGRPWYQDVDTNERIEIAPEWLEGSSVRIGTPIVLIGPDGRERPELSITERHCVQSAAGQAWVGGPYVAWEPWDRHLGDVAYLAHEILHSGRGNEGGPPPAAVVLDPSPVSDPPKEKLRQLDAEIATTGLGHWSSVFPEFYLGRSGSYEPAHGEGGVFGYNRENWIVYPGPGGFGSGAIDGSHARRFVDYETPAGNTVSAFDETMTVWEDCAHVVVPEFFPGPFESGYESEIDSDGGLAMVYVYHADHETLTRLLVNYRDPACVAHSVLGPIIEHLLAAD
jgi:hypothetical protein